MLRRLLFGNPYETRTEIEGVVQEIDDNESGHNFDEVQILSGHNDIVDLIINIDDQRILTTGQDKKGIVWDCKTGKMVCELVGHKRAITAAIIIRKYLDSIEDFSDVIVTASSDEAIKVKNGELHKTLSGVITRGDKHIKEDCQVCQLKGFICEVCSSDEILYPFELRKVHVCQSCKTCSHRSCYVKGSCKRCERIKARKLLVQADLPESPELE